MRLLGGCRERVFVNMWVEVSGSSGVFRISEASEEALVPCVCEENQGGSVKDCVWFYVMLSTVKRMVTPAPTNRLRLKQYLLMFQCCF